MVWLLIALVSCWKALRSNFFEFQRILWRKWEIFEVDIRYIQVGRYQFFFFFFQSKVYQARALIRMPRTHPSVTALKRKSVISLRKKNRGLFEKFPAGVGVQFWCVLNFSCFQLRKNVCPSEKIIKSNCIKLTSQLHWTSSYHQIRSASGESLITLMAFCVHLWALKYMDTF